MFSRYTITMMPINTFFTRLTMPMMLLKIPVMTFSMLGRISVVVCTQDTSFSTPWL